MLGNYLEAIVREDQQLLKVYSRLNSLVLAEIAATTTQIKDQMGHLTLCSESILQHVQSLEGQIQDVRDVQISLVGQSTGSTLDASSILTVRLGGTNSEWRLKEWLNPITTMEDEFCDLRNVRVAGTCDWIFED